MQIQAIGSVGYQAQAIKNASTASQTQSSSSTTSSSSSSTISGTYDVMDTNHDGVVTLKERMAYYMKLAAEEEAAREESQRYNRNGQLETAPQTVVSSFSYTA